MPSIGAIIGGTITLLIGIVIFTNFRDHGRFSHDRDIRFPWEHRRYPVGYYQIGSLVAGLLFVWFGLNTLKFDFFSILMLVPAIPVLFHFKIVGQVLMVFFSRREPSERAIVNGQYILLVVTLVWIAGAIYFSVKNWITIAAE